MFIIVNILLSFISQFIKVNLSNLIPKLPHMNVLHDSEIKLPRTKKLIN